MVRSESSTDARTFELMVRQIRFEGHGIQSYEFVDPAGKPLPAFTAGAHIDVYLKNGVVRQYSLCNPPGEQHRYVIAVLRDEAGRGGSKSLHDSVHVQDRIKVSAPRNNFELASEARKVILLAGGIGVTPLKAMAHALDTAGIDYEMHYCAKNAQCTAFESEFATMHDAGKLHFHFDEGDPAKGLNIAKLLEEPIRSTHVYYCGPGGFMKACAAATAHWPAGTVHFEHFKAPEPVKRDDAPQAGEFVVKIASTGQHIPVSADQSIADALEEAGVAIETSCRAGLCGTCKVRYLSGDVDHQDCILGDDEKREYLTTCVSRAVSRELVLDL
jgi:vanillate O-demethylase ferredoxin subunit